MSSGRGHLPVSLEDCDRGVGQALRCEETLEVVRHGRTADSTADDSDSGRLRRDQAADEEGQSHIIAEHARTREIA